MPSLKLSQGFIDKVVPALNNKKVDYFDTEVSGLMLRVLASGTKTYSCRYRDLRNKQVERKLGCASVLRLGDARERVVGIQRDLAMGVDPFELRRILQSVPLFGEFVVDSYMPHIKGYKRSWDTDESILRNHVLPKLGKLPLDQVRQHHVRAVLDLHRTTHEPASTNRVLILVRYIFNCALKWEIEGLERNPTHGIALYPVNNQRERYLNKEETMRLFKALELSPNRLLPYIVSMLLLTGARRNEVLTARWDDLDVVNKQWRIEFNKTGKTRYVPISEGLIALLAKVPKRVGNPFVFPNPLSGLPFTTIFNSWNSARKKAGLTDVRIHDLRHSFASYLINQGRSLYEVQKLLGHTQIKTTQRYAHLSNESLLSAVNSAAASVPWGTQAVEPVKGHVMIAQVLTDTKQKLAKVIEGQAGKGRFGCYGDRENKNKK